MNATFQSYCITTYSFLINESKAISFDFKEKLCTSACFSASFVTAFANNNWERQKANES